MIAWVVGRVDLRAARAVQGRKTDDAAQQNCRNHVLLLCLIRPDRQCFAFDGYQFNSAEVSAVE